MRTYLPLFISLSFIPSLLHANETYEVIDSPLASSMAGSTTTIYSSQEIEAYQDTFIDDALDAAPSVIVTPTGTPGRQVDFSIRGARSAQNLVVMDGVYVNDPASGGGVDLGNFLTPGYEKIEVLPGPQNLAYGPGALGGVIQLVPQRGQGKPSFKGRAEGGSFRTKNGTLIAQGEEGPLQFFASGTGFWRGPSPFTNQLHGNRQSDRFRNGTFATRVGYAVTDNWEIEGVARYIQGKVQFDSPRFDPREGVSFPIIAPNFSTTKILLTSLDNTWGDETWEHSLKVSYAQTRRNTEMPGFKNDTLGDHPLISYRTDVRLAHNLTLKGGLEGGQERAKNDQTHKRRHGGIYVIPEYKPFETTTLQAGLRGDRYQSLGGRFLYSLGGEQKIGSNTALRASFGTNFKPPVLSDLFQRGPWQEPNPALNPEKSRSLEGGLDQTFLSKRARVSITGFHNRISQITLTRQVRGGRYQRYNGSRRVTKGLEIALAIKPISPLELKSAFAVLHSRDFPGGRKSPQIPRFKGAGGFHWQALPQASVFAQAVGISSREDSITRRRLPPHFLLDIGGTVDITKEARLFWRIENINNKHYEDVYGYGKRGRAFFFGLEATT